jgi:soluble cytochrome b562
MKTDLKFIFDIINGKIDEYERMYDEGEISVIEGEAAVEALINLRTTLKSFIDEANKL